MDVSCHCFIRLQVIFPNNKCNPYQPANFNLTVNELFKAELYLLHNLFHWHFSLHKFLKTYLQNLSVNGLLNNFIIGAEAFS